MRRAWPIGVATVIMSWQAQGDEPKKKYQIVSPRDVGINATGINGRGDIVGFEWIASKKYPGVIDQVPFFASGKTITYLLPRLVLALAGPLEAAQRTAQRPRFAQRRLRHRPDRVRAPRGRGPGHGPGNPARNRLAQVPSARLGPLVHAVTQ
jgi:hypothetical protein